jgi:5-methylcytosine-specific restriction endonuclease McrA
MIDADGLKKCAKCRESKLAAEHFYPAVKRADGYDPYCKACHAEKHRRAKAANPAGLRERTRKNAAAWRAKNPDKAVATAKRYAAKKRAETAAKLAAVALPEGMKRCSSCKEVKDFSCFAPDKRRAHGIGSYCVECNRAKVAKRAKKYARANSVTVNARMSARRRTAAYKEWERQHNQKPHVRAVLRDRWRLKAARVKAETYKDGVIVRSLEMEGEFTRADWLALLKEFEHSCAYCGAETRLTMEHLTPLSRKGKNEVGNIVPACLPCNASKGDKTLEEFAPDQAAEIRQRALLH